MPDGKTWRLSRWVARQEKGLGLRSTASNPAGLGPQTRARGGSDGSVGART